MEAAASGPIALVPREVRGLWFRWVAANAIGEALGLSATALASMALFAALSEATGVLVILALAAAAVVAGAIIEGVTVGSAQWLVLRHPLPGLTWPVWAGATAAGAGLAWALGMLPSTIISIGEETGETAATEPSAVVVCALAFLMGLVLGPVLGCAQWLVLRRHVPRAGLWMPANAIAWAFGMVMVFAGVSLVADSGVTPATVASLIVILAATGAVVGAIHGLALVRLLARRAPEGRVGGVFAPVTGH